MKALLIPFAILTLCASGPNARAIDDDEDHEEALGFGSISYRNNCMMCHHGGLVESQRLSRAQWEAEVTKMVGWGAPLPEPERANLIEYLVTEYGPEGPLPELPRRAIPAFETTHSPPDRRASTDEAKRGASLYGIHCASCHGGSAVGGEVGINLVAKPILLDEDAYRAILKAGRNRMPGFGAVLKPEDEADILDWLRGLQASRAPLP